MSKKQLQRLQAQAEGIAWRKGYEKSLDEILMLRAENAKLREELDALKRLADNISVFMQGVV